MINKDISNNKDILSNNNTFSNTSIFNNYLKEGIVQGNNLDLIKNIPDNTIDFIFLDPPYNMQIDKKEGLLKPGTKKTYTGVIKESWDKFSSLQAYDDFTLTYLKDNGVLVCIGSYQNIFRVGYILQNLNAWILNDIVWNKPNAMPNFSGTRLANAHETLIVVTKTKKAKPTFNYKTMKHLNNNKQLGSVWNINTCIGAERLKDENGKKLHSTQKPEALLDYLILAYTKKDDIVLDIFAGTGTSLACAKKWGRRFIGFELENNYVQAVKTRLNNQQQSKHLDILNAVFDKKPKSVSYQEIKEKFKINNLFVINDNREKLDLILNNDGSVSYKGKTSTPNAFVRNLFKRPSNAWLELKTVWDGKVVALNDFRKILQKEKEGKK